MNKDIADETVRLLREYLLDGEISVDDGVEVQKVKPPTMNSEYVGIAISGDARELFVGAGVMLAVVMQTIDERIKNGSQYDSNVLRDMRDSLFEAFAINVVHQIPINKFTTNGKEILY